MTYKSNDALLHARVVNWYTVSGTAVYFDGQLLVVLI